MHLNRNSAACRPHDTDEPRHGRETKCGSISVRHSMPSKHGPAFSSTMQQPPQRSTHSNLANADQRLNCREPAVSSTASKAISKKRQSAAVLLTCNQQRAARHAQQYAPAAAARQTMQCIVTAAAVPAGTQLPARIRMCQQSVEVTVAAARRSRGLCTAAARSKGARHDRLQTAASS